MSFVYTIYNFLFPLLLKSLFSEPVHAPDHLAVDRAPNFEEEDLNNGPEVCDPSDNEEGSVIEEEIVEPPTLIPPKQIPPTQMPPTQISENKDLPAVDSAPENLEDAPKKSYASIVSSC